MQSYLNTNLSKHTPPSHLLILKRKVIKDTGQANKASQTQADQDSDESLYIRRDTSEPIFCIMGRINREVWKVGHPKSNGRCLIFIKDKINLSFRIFDRLRWGNRSCRKDA